MAIDYDPLAGDPSLRPHGVDSAGNRQETGRTFRGQITSVEVFDKISYEDWSNPLRFQFQAQCCCLQQYAIHLHVYRLYS